MQARHPHVMTAARKAALRKAQRASAMKRRGRSNRAVSLYHYTTNRTARKIVRQQKFKLAVRRGTVTPANPFNQQGYVYFSKRKNDPYWGRGITGQRYGQVSVKVPGRFIERDPNDYEIMGKKVTPTKKQSSAYRVQIQHLDNRPIKLVYARQRTVFGHKIRSL